MHIFQSIVHIRCVLLSNHYIQSVNTVYHMENGEIWWCNSILWQHPSLHSFGTQGLQNTHEYTGILCFFCLLPDDLAIYLSLFSDFLSFQRPWELSWPVDVPRQDTASNMSCLECASTAAPQTYVTVPPAVEQSYCITSAPWQACCCWGCGCDMRSQLVQGLNNRSNTNMELGINHLWMTLYIANSQCLFSAPHVKSLRGGLYNTYIRAMCNSSFCDNDFTLDSLSQCQNRKANN